MPNLDVDECLNHCKTDNAFCINLDGSFECNCSQGYLFNTSTLKCDGL